MYGTVMYAPGDVRYEELAEPKILLIDLVLTRKINPGKVFDLELPLSEVAEGYKAMDERRAIKTLLRV